MCTFSKEKCLFAALCPMQNDFNYSNGDATIARARAYNEEVMLL